MKNTILIVTLFLNIMFFSCNNNEPVNNEPDEPWLIYFFENFSLIHNDSQEFKNWLDAHVNNIRFVTFTVDTGDKTIELYPDKSEVESYYSKSMSGYISWLVRISNVSEDEVKTICTEFEAFTIEEDKDRYDKFTTQYGKPGDFAASFSK
ncbi:MAG: hypothetical protein K2M94_07375 [Paramuribaculum sp.]|nr:hypothetical protein [Paramuribaculum sp.]